MSSIKLRLPPLEVTPDDPFRRDALNLEEHITTVADFVFRIDGNAVLSLNGGWGSGKSTFLRILEQVLIDRGVSTVFFNAWDCDYSEDPIVPLFGAFNERAKETFGDEEVESTYLHKAKAGAIGFAKSSLPLAVKLVTSGFVDLEKLQGGDDTIDLNKIADFAGKQINEAIERHGTEKKQIDEFRANLERVSTALAGKTGAPLVFFVDELDRCRPPFAIRLLERAKHLFSTRNLVFILGMDKTQLSHSIRSIYGDSFDAIGYLRRFIDLEFSLQQPDAIAYSKMRIERIGLGEVFAERKKHSGLDEADQLATAIGLLASRFSLSLREINQCISRCVVAVNTIPAHYHAYPVALGTYVFMIEKEPDKWALLTSEPGHAKQIVDEWRGLGFESFPAGRGILASIAVLEAKIHDYEAFIDDLRVEWKHIADQRKRGGSFPEVAVRMYEDFEIRPDYLIKKLNLLDKFVDPTQTAD